MFACVLECMHREEPQSPLHKARLPHSTGHPGSLRAPLGARWPLLRAEPAELTSPIPSSCCGQALGSQQATLCLVHCGHLGVYNCLFSPVLRNLLFSGRRSSLARSSPPFQNSLSPGRTLNQIPNDFLMEPCGSCLNFPRGCCLVSS